jgi:hypothetical protein
VTGTAKLAELKALHESLSARTTGPVSTAAVQQERRAAGARAEARAARRSLNGWCEQQPRARARLPPGYTIAALAGPVHPLCGHASPVRPGSDVWADDCAELAEYSRPFAGFPPGCDEYACAQHARCPDSPGRLAWGITG